LNAHTASNTLCLYWRIFNICCKCLQQIFYVSNKTTPKYSNASNHNNSYGCDSSYGCYSLNTQEPLAFDTAVQFCVIYNKCRLVNGARQYGLNNPVLAAFDNGYKNVLNDGNSYNGIMRYIGGNSYNRESTLYQKVVSCRKQIGLPQTNWFDYKSADNSWSRTQFLNKVNSFGYSSWGNQAGTVSNYMNDCTFVLELFSDIMYNKALQAAIAAGQGGSQGWGWQNDPTRIKLRFFNVMGLGPTAMFFFDLIQVR